MPARPSAGIGVVEVQKPMVFAISYMLARPSAGIGVRGSAWPRCKNPWFFFAISAVPAQPSAGIGVVEVQKPMFFCDFCGARALCRNRRGRGAKTRGFFATTVVRIGPRELSRGSRGCSRNRRVAGSIPPWSAAGRRKMQHAFFKATCAEQVAQSNLRRPTCTDQFAQSTLPGAVSLLLHKCFVEGKRTHPAALGRPRLRCYAFGPTVV